MLGDLWMKFRTCFDMLWRTGGKELLVPVNLENLL
jgi:hypothetical protein